MPDSARAPTLKAAPRNADRWARIRASARGEIAGGLASSIPGFVYALTLGLVVYAPLGAAHADLGLRAGFAGAVFGAAAAALVSRSALPASGPRASVALVLAGFVLTAAQDPALSASHIVALTAACVACAGIVQILFGAMGIGTVAHFVPYPVVAGFMCGIAALIVISQLAALGVEWVGPGWAAPVRVDFAALGVGLATAAAIGWLGRHRPRWPALLIGLLVGVAAHYLLTAIAAGGSAGPQVGVLPSNLLSPQLAGLQALTTPESARHTSALLTTALVIAIIGSLDTLLAAVAVDVVAGTRHRANQELMAQGLGNVVAGLFGGIPIALSGVRAISAYRAGGRTRASALIAAGTIGVVGYTSVPFLERLPLAALAGVMLMIAWALVDEWTRALGRRLAAGTRSPELFWSASVVLVVAAATVLLNFIVAVIAGVFLSMGLFIAAMNRTLVRAVYPGSVRPSRRIYGPEMTSRLDEARGHIRVVELEGALFFGSTEQLDDKLEAILPAAQYVVLDLSRLSAIDATGAVALERIARRTAEGETRLLLVGSPRQRAMLRSTGSLRHVERASWFADADQAIELAERALLGASTGTSEIPLERLMLAHGLDPQDLTVLRGALARIEIPAGETLFREGEAGDRLYVLACGAVAILVAAELETQRRIITFAPGAMFGEAAMLDGRTRSATATITEDAVLYILSRESLEAMAEASPRTVVKLLENVGRQLSSHLRHTTNVLLEAWDVRR